MSVLNILTSSITSSSWLFFIVVVTKLSGLFVYLILSVVTIVESSKIFQLIAFSALVVPKILKLSVFHSLKDVLWSLKMVLKVAIVSLKLCQLSGLSVLSLEESSRTFAESEVSSRDSSVVVSCSISKMRKNNSSYNIVIFIGVLLH